METSISVSPSSVYSRASVLSMKRFGAYFRYYVASNSKGLLLSAGIIFVAAFAIQLLMFYSNARYFYGDAAAVVTTPSTDVMWQSRCEMYSILFMLIMIIAGSKMFGEISQRSDRLRTLEIPASQFEKFLTWLIIYLPLTCLVTWLCFWIADILLICWGHIFTPFGGKMKLLSLTQIIATKADGISTPQATLNLVSYYSFAIIFNSLYVVGSILFHRLAFLKTSIALFLLGTLMAIAVFIGISVFQPHGIYDSVFDLPNSQYSSSFIVGLGAAVVYFLIYLYCYARLRQEEVITRW